MHGRADFASISFVRRNRTEEGESESEQSAGGKTVCEAKRAFDGVDIDQLVAQAVVSSFTHRNRHGPEFFGTRCRVVNVGRWPLMKYTQLYITKK